MPCRLLLDPGCCCGDVCTEFYCSDVPCKNEEILEEAERNAERLVAVHTESNEDCNRTNNYLFYICDSEEDMKKLIDEWREWPKKKREECEEMERKCKEEYEECVKECIEEECGEGEEKCIEGCRDGCYDVYWDCYSGCSYDVEVEILRGGDALSALYFVWDIGCACEDEEDECDDVCEEC